jgi:sulfur-carrier protein adenylyltransferase/sulfurtransferase
MTEDFSRAELARYARHFVLPEFGMEGQRRLKNSSVLVVGAGGLGCPMLLYLAAAGVGRIGIVDPDRVDDSNLQRQVLYTTSDVGKYKVEAAKERLLALNPHITIETYPFGLMSDNALKIIELYDLVADGTDNFPTRYLVNDACVLQGKVNVYASIFRFEGQVSVFNFSKNEGERGVNYRDIFPTPPPPGLVPDCAEGGVLGVLPGIIGSMQASEVIKILSGVGEPLAGRLFIFDAADFTTRVLKLSKSPNYQPITELIDYDMFCGLAPQPPKGEQNTEGPLSEISVQELVKWRTQNIDFQLVDVREGYEYEAANIGGTLIQLSILVNNLDLISTEKPVVVHCKSGARSAKAIALLKSHGFTNLINLKGGILAYAKEIDTHLTIL